MPNTKRQQLLSTLARSSLADIEQVWSSTIDAHDFEVLRQPETGMVMAVGRAGGTGEAFNVVEVAVTRCAVRLSDGVVGVGYVRGRSPRHAQTVALIDALAQQVEQADRFAPRLVAELDAILAQKAAAGQARADQTRVEFFTLVRGEND